MELSERYIRTLESEGFTYVYEAQDRPGAIHKEHSHVDKVSVYITDGSLTFDFSCESVRGTDARGCQPSSSEEGDNQNSFCKKKRKEVHQNKRFDVPPNTPHTVTAGPEGAIYIVGEMIDEDS
ncbi:MAG: hypothetical protein ACI92I_000252 [Acidimicrobiales bacterium]|jgi:hypothetical protein